MYGVYRGAKAIDNKIARNKAQKALLDKSNQSASNKLQPSAQQQQTIEQSQQWSKPAQAQNAPSSTKAQIGGHRQNTVVASKEVQAQAKTIQQRFDATTTHSSSSKVLPSAAQVITHSRAKTTPGIKI